MTTRRSAVLVGTLVLGALCAAPTAAAPRRAHVSWPQGSAAYALKGSAVQALARTGAHSVLAGTPKGMNRSTDGGKTWHKSGPSGNVTVLTADPTSPNSQKVYAGIDGTLYRTTNSGGTWTALAQVGTSTTPPLTITAIAAHGSTVAVGADSTMWLSHDTAATWTAAASDPGGINDIVISGTTIYFGGRNVGFGEIVNGRGPGYENEGLPAQQFVGGQPNGWDVTSVIGPTGAHGQVTVLACGGNSYSLEPAQIGAYQWSLSGYTLPSGDKLVSCGAFNPQPIGHGFYGVGNRSAVAVCTMDGCSPQGYSHAKVAILSVALGDPAKKGGPKRLLLGTAKGLQWFTLRAGIG